MGDRGVRRGRAAWRAFLAVVSAMDVLVRALVANGPPFRGSIDRLFTPHHHPRPGDSGYCTTSIPYVPSEGRVHFPGAGRPDVRRRGPDLRIKRCHTIPYQVRVSTSDACILLTSRSHPIHTWARVARNASRRAAQTGGNAPRSDTRDETDGFRVERPSGGFGPNLRHRDPIP